MTSLSDDLLIALDPALRSPGVAVFLGGALVACARVKVPTAYAKLARGERVAAVVAKIVETVSAVPAVAAALAARAVLRDAELAGRPPDSLDGLRRQARIAVAYEWPQIYAATRSKGDPNDVVPLAAIGAAFAIAMGAEPADIAAPTPAEWVGQLPKTTTGPAWQSPRGARVRVRLTPEELALVPEQHDVIDAVAIGLWRVGRFERRVVIAR